MVLFAAERRKTVKSYGSAGTVFMSVQYYVGLK